MKTGLQLYTIRDSYGNSEEFKASLKTVKELGYEQVEFAGYGDLSAVELKEYIEEIGLTTISCHRGLVDLSDTLEDTIKYNKELGIKYIVCAFAPTSSREEMDQLLTILNNAKAAIAEAGMELLYHNHSHEFLPLEDGTLPMNLIKECVRLELDTFWVFHAGVEPCAYLKDNADRIALVHIKDGSFEGKPCAIGEGYNNIKGIVNMAEIIGMDSIIVENDNPVPDGLSDVKRSIENLKGIIG
ncbi:MAG: Xylose isomerase domain protein barrel [Anaerocolumna sp.]|jgi:sugar phosphate isomerase/epimerase|nr:Xylose isomerase domain protein barrel [Anaerocolumna sp.]